LFVCLFVCLFLIFCLFAFSGWGWGGYMYITLPFALHCDNIVTCRYANGNDTCMFQLLHTVPGLHFFFHDYGWEENRSLIDSSNYWFFFTYRRFLHTIFVWYRRIFEREKADRLKVTASLLLWQIVKGSQTIFLKIIFFPVWYP
jgi:hypothetical protein